MENHNDYEYWNNKGREYFAQNNFTDAIKCFEKRDRPFNKLWALRCGGKKEIQETGKRKLKVFPPQAD